MITRLMLLLLAVGLLTGCATPTEKLISTPSGRPEVVMTTKDVGLVKAKLLGRYLNNGYNMESESSYALVMARKPRGSMEELAISLSVGNSYSDNSVVVNFSLVPVEEGTRVVATVQARAVMPSGKVNTENWDSAFSFNSHLEQLRIVQWEIETGRNFAQGVDQLPPLGR